MEARLPFSFAKRFNVFVSNRFDDSIEITYSDNLNIDAIKELRRVLKQPLQFKKIEQGQFETQLAAAYEAGADSAMAAITGLEEDLDLSAMISQIPATKDLLETEGDAPIIRLINAIITQAIKQAASDIHFETFEEKLTIRYRTDGVLRETLQPPRVLAPLIVSRLKVMAKLDIAEKRLPQDGRISLKIAGRSIDVRVSTIPTHYGERIVLRLLDKQSAPLNLKKLGMEQQALNDIEALISRPHGIILVTGPTGSGKTTTLYGALTQLNNATRNIMTVEDPIEYYLPGIGQTQVNTKIGMSFAKGLRAILRQDPDVVMVGEIRDLETTEMAIQASLTGHLVLSTLHTNSAIGAITRLRDMGAEPFLLSSTIIGVAAQRLVRVLCDACKEKKPVTGSEKIMLGLDSDAKAFIFHANGCDVCANSGYLGRTGIYEIIMIDETMRSMIHDNVAEDINEKHARINHPSIRQDGWRKVLAGDTTIDEVLRKVGASAEL